MSMINAIYRIDGHEYNIIEYTILYNPYNLKNIIVHPQLDPNMKNAYNETVLHILLRTIYCDKIINIFMQKSHKKIDYDTRDFLDISIKDLALAYTKHGSIYKKRMAFIVLSYIK